ncbi:MAG: hypothetical protein IPM77_08375 [Crocinitomicaceae bacterium]|nr:hypothetical protein [Crocinitomicaceae bacterium]
MSASELKLLIHTLIDGVNDNPTLQAFYTLLAKSVDLNSDWGKELPADVKKRLIKSIKQMESGKLMNHDSVRLELKKKYPSLHL